MNYLKISFIAVNLLLLTSNTVMAARQALLFLGTSRQSIAASYDFSNSSFGKTSSHEQRMIENYGFGIDYAIFKPEILNGSFNINLLASQNDSSGSSSNNSSSSTSKLGFLYDISGDFFGKSASPIKVFYKSQISDVQRSFGGSYQLNSDIFGANWVLRNKIMPLAFSYSSSVSSTDGTPDDRTFSNEEVSIHASHFKGGSQTFLDLTNTVDRYELKSGASGSVNRQYKISFRHTLDWNEADLKRSLNSSVTVYEAANLSTRSSSTDWQESLLWDLGKALKSNLNYIYNSASTNRGSQQSNALIARLQHNLFRSLTTNLQVNGRYFDDDYGAESEINGRISLAYRKILPENSSLDIGAYKQYGITDRTQNSQIVLMRTVLKETHTVVFGKRLILGYPNYMPGSISIYNASASIRPANLFYSEGADFHVDTTGPMAEVIVVPGSSLDIDVSTPDGNNLLITYDYQLDNNQRYATSSQGINGGVGIMEGKYRIFGGIDQSIQESLSGAAQSSRLNSYLRVNAGLSAKWYKYSLTTQITKTDSIFDHSRSLDSSIDYSDALASGTVVLYLRDSYRWYAPFEGNSRDSDTVISLGGNYNIPSVFYGSMTLRADYVKWLSNVDSDRLSVGADFHWKVRKFVVSLRSNLAYTQVGGNLSESESIRLMITRYF